MQAPRGIEAWRNLPLPRLASRLARSALCVGNDSGISHLAAAVGCPLLVLFGPTRPGVWAPRGVGVRIMRSATGRLDALRVQEVFGVIGKLLDVIERDD